MDHESSQTSPTLDLERLQAEGVYDATDAKAADRLAFLSHLAELGATTDQMIEADRAGTLRSLGADLMMFDIGRSTTITDLAAQVGLPAELVQRIRIATGFAAEPDSVVPEWTTGDVGVFSAAAAMFGEPAVLAFNRVMGACAARIAEAGLALFLNEVESSFADPAMTEMDRGRAVEQATSLFPVISVIMTHLLREHLMTAVRRQRAMSQSSPIAGDTPTGFVDLVGSTGWASGISLRTQADAIAHFESAAWDIATRRGGRIVKLIGDEVMFTASDPGEACHIALDICLAVDEEPMLPAARGAVGTGDVIYRDGDYYGPLVHLVARSVKAASPGAVVVTTSILEALGGADRADLAFERLGSKALRGIEEPVELYAVSAR